MVGSDVLICEKAWIESLKGDELKKKDDQDKIMAGNLSRMLTPARSVLSKNK